MSPPQLGAEGAPLHRLAIASAVLVAGFLPGVARADSGPSLIFPPALIPAASERSFPGLWEPLEAGAALVRSSDSPAVWYNPAGIVLTDRSNINANAPGYQFIAYWGSSENRPAQGSNLRGLPSFVGAILGSEVIPWRNVRLGFGLTNPISAQQSLLVSQSMGAGQRSSYLVNSDLESYQGQGAIAWAPWPWLRLGLTLGMSYDNISSTAQSSAEATSSAYSGSLNISTINADTQQFVSSAGVQWDAFPWLSFGLVVRPPAVKLRGNSDLRFDGVFNAGQEQQEHFEGNGSFEFRMPLQINFGMAVQIRRRVNLEADLFWHQASGTYTLLSSPASMRLVTAGAGGSAPVTTSISFPDVRTSTRSLLNVSVGGNYHFASIWWVHGGLYIDQTPTGDNDPFFQPINFYGVRTGVSLRESKGLSGSLGLGYELGVSNRPPGTISPIGNTAVAQGDLTVHTFSLLLAVGYHF